MLGIRACSCELLCLLVCERGGLRQVQSSSAGWILLSTAYVKIGTVQMVSSMAASGVGSMALMVRLRTCCICSQLSSSATATLP